MAEAGLQAPDIPAPPQLPAQPHPVQQPAQPTWQVQQPVQQTHQAQQVVHLNWSHFKPEFSGKPEEAEAPLLRTNNQMKTHYFQEGTKVQTFCLTLV